MIHLHHVHLFSQDLDATVAWYRRAFDAEVYYDGDFGGSRNVFMKIASGRIHLYAQPPRENGKGAIHHIGIRTRDLVGLRDVCYRWESDLAAEFANSAHGVTSCAPRQTRYSSSCSKS